MWGQFSNNLTELNNLQKEMDKVIQSYNKTTWDLSCSSLLIHSSSPSALNNGQESTVLDKKDDVKNNNVLDDTQKPRAKAGIVLISTKFNKSDETMLLHLNNHSNNTNSDKPMTTEEQENKELMKTATILVSKSKTKTGLPLMLKKPK